MYLTLSRPTYVRMTAMRVTRKASSFVTKRNKNSCLRLPLTNNARSELTGELRVLVLPHHTIAAIRKVENSTFFKYF